MLGSVTRTGDRDGRHWISAKLAGPVGRPIRIATSGLVVVLLVLTVFSVTVAVTNAGAAERAE